MEITEFYCHSFSANFSSNQRFTKELYWKLVWRFSTLCRGKVVKKHYCFYGKISIFSVKWTFHYNKELISRKFLSVIWFAKYCLEPLTIWFHFWKKWNCCFPHFENASIFVRFKTVCLPFLDNSPIFCFLHFRSISSLLTVGLIHQLEK